MGTKNSRIKKKAIPIPTPKNIRTLNLEKNAEISLTI
jgi:hypothetical protein